MKTEKYRGCGEVISSVNIGQEIWDLRLKNHNIASCAMPGQFVALYCKDQSRLLPRPISICEADPDTGVLRLVYRVAGKGTAEFSGLLKGDTVDLMGPLGNGFPLEEAEGKCAFLIGGGIGIPPMLELAKRLPGQKKIVAGYRDECFLAEDLKKYGELYIATEDGSCGTCGNVLDCIRENSLTPDVIFACGPKPMLRALSGYAEERGIPCWISLEERMACGIGACLACVCKTVDTDAHSQVKNARICADGPVFLSSKVEL